MRIALGTDQGIIILKPNKSDVNSWVLHSHVFQGRKIQTILADKHNAIVAASSQGSIHKTKDGENWMTTIEGLEGLNIFSLCSHPADPLTMFAGTQPPAIYRSNTGGLRWQKIPSFNELPTASQWNYPIPPYRATVTKIIQHPLHSNVVMATVAQGGFMGSLDNGLTWKERSISPGREINDMVLHEDKPTRIIAATSTGLFRSEDLGSTWEMTQHGVPYTFAWKLAISPENPDFIMASLSQRREDDSPQILVTSIDGGTTWQIKNNGLPSLNGQRISAIAAAGRQTFAFAVATGNVYLTTNGGEYWHTIYYNTIPVRSILLAD